MKTKKQKTEVWLTEGMDGKRVEKLFEVSDISTVMKKITHWKSLKKTKAGYKVEPYDRIMHNDTVSRAVIDFGDWHWFIVVDPVSKEDFNKMINFTEEK